MIVAALLFGRDNFAKTIPAMLACMITPTMDCMHWRTTVSQHWLVLPRLGFQVPGLTE